MSYKIDYEKIDSFRESMGRNTNSQSGNLEFVSSTISALIGSNGISGATADRMRSYMSDVHVSVLSLFHNVFQMLVAGIIQYQVGYAANVDSGTDARFSSDEFSKMKKDILSLKNKTVYIDDGVKQALRSAASVYAPNEVGGYPGVDSILSFYDTISKNIDLLDQAITSMEEGFSSSILAQIDSVLDALEAYIDANRGHNSMYISSYTPASRSELYNVINKYHQVISAYFDENGEQYSKMVQFVTHRTYERNQARIDAELDKELDAAARKVRILGYVGDACFTVLEISLTAFGIPEPAVNIVGGTANGSWSGYYTGISDQLESYHRGDGELINQSELNQSIVVGTIKGGTSSTITVGMGAIFDGIGELPVIDSLTNAHNPVIKHGSDIVLKTVEKRSTDIVNNAVDRYVDTAAQQYREGSAYQGKSPLDAALDPDAILSDITDKGELAKATVKSTVSDFASTWKKSSDSEIDTPEKLQRTHGVGRVVKSGIAKGVETATGEIIGTGVETVVTTDDVDRFVATGDAMKSLFTDDEKLEGLISKSASSTVSGAAKDYYEQRHESEIIQYNIDRRRQERATAALGTDKPIGVDKYGNPDYSQTTAIYTDKRTDTQASVTIELEDGDRYDAIVAKAEEEYRDMIKTDDFSTPDGYRWVLKYDQSFDSHKVTLQLVQGTKVPSQVFD